MLAVGKNFENSSIFQQSGYTFCKLYPPDTPKLFLGVYTPPVPLGSLPALEEIREQNLWKNKTTDIPIYFKT